MNLGDGVRSALCDGIKVIGQVRKHFLGLGELTLCCKLDRLRTDDIGAPVVAAGPAFATFLQLQGMTASKKVFSQGDYLTVAGEMFEVVQDATSDSAGKATITVNKPIRKTLVAGAAVEYRNPYSEMRRMDNTNSSSVQPLVASLSLQFREAF